MNALCEVSAMPTDKLSTAACHSLFEPDRRSTPRSVTPWELLVWTYRDQQAHRYLKRPGDWYAYMVDLGGFAGADAPRPKLHSDAVQVHTAVIEQGQAAAALLIEYAAKNMMPEPTDMVSRPQMIVADRQIDRFSWTMVDGQRRDYRIIVVDSFVETVPAYRKLGKGRRSHIGTETRIVEVEACPIEYWPAPEYLLMIDAIHQQFMATLESLEPSLRALAFKRHVLVD